MLKFLLLSLSLVACSSTVTPDPSPDAADCIHNIKGECRTPGDAGNEFPRIDAPAQCMPVDAPTETLPQCADSCDPSYHYPFEVCGVYYYDVCTKDNSHCLSASSH